MANELIYIGFLAPLSWLDWKTFTIPNWIVLPAILIGVLMTGHWQAVVTMFAIGTMFSRLQHKCGRCDFMVTLNQNFLWCGGDVKLFCMSAAFVGWMRLWILAASVATIEIYRHIRNFHGSLAVTPFFAFASIVVLAVTHAAKLIR